LISRLSSDDHSLDCSFTPITTAHPAFSVNQPLSPIRNTERNICRAHWQELLIDSLSDGASAESDSADAIAHEKARSRAFEGRTIYKHWCGSTSSL
jgi:hypothetical protein